MEGMSKGMAARAEWILQNIRDCIEFLSVCWVFLMLTVFPLYAPEKYQQLGGYKFSFFSGTSAFLLIPGLVLAAVYVCGKILLRYAAGEKNKPGVNVSLTDLGVLLYLAANVISYLLSDFKTEAWEGVGGWNMGLRTQLLMIAAYILISRFFPYRVIPRKKDGDCGSREPGVSLAVKVVLCGAFIGISLTFLLGVLHRFDIDPLGMYTGIDSSYKIWFLSTVGQATWYSSFVCTVLPMGIGLFCFGGKSGRMAAAFYCALGFMTLVTQNSDSAFAALGFLFLGLFLVCLCNVKWMERFLQIWILCAVSFLFTGLLQKVFAERAIALGELSLLFSQGAVGWIMLLAGSAAYLLLIWGQRKEKRRKKLDNIWKKYRRRVQTGVITAFVVGAVLAVTVISWNTQNAANGGSAMIGSGSYLIFTDSWGSNRGFTWKTTARIFEEMSIENKLFGAGPDCYYPYSYTVSGYAQTLHDFWKPDILTNAHNEFLNLLICVGAFGLAAFLLLLFGGCWRFYQAGKKNPFVWMGVLVICSYAAHNFFCYQQVCCTPFLFLFLGIAERAARQMNDESIEQKRRYGNEKKHQSNRNTSGIGYENEGDA